MQLFVLVGELGLLQSVLEFVVGQLFAKFEDLLVFLDHKLIDFIIAHNALL